MMLAALTPGISRGQPGSLEGVGMCSNDIALAPGVIGTGDTPLSVDGIDGAAGDTVADGGAALGNVEASSILLASSTSCRCFSKYDSWRSTMDIVTCSLMTPVIIRWMLMRMSFIMSLTSASESSCGI